MHTTAHWPAGPCDTQLRPCPRTPAPQLAAHRPVRRCRVWRAVENQQNGGGTDSEPYSQPSRDEAASMRRRVSRDRPSPDSDDLLFLMNRLSRLTDQLEQQNRKIATLEMNLQRARDEVAQSATPQSSPVMSPFEAQSMAGFGDRRLIGGFDARFHSTSGGATPRDFRILPERIFLVRHAESLGNASELTYANVPDSQVPLTQRGREQAEAAGLKIKQWIEERNTSRDYKLFFYTSPYKRSLETYEHIAQVFRPDQVTGVQEEVQLREQDFGNFQDPEGKRREKAERLRFGRFYYRFPDGESGADVYDRLTLFEDHLVRDINAGRFAGGHNLVIVTHGLALRIFLMRWYHWTVDQFLSVWNPLNAEPLVMERVPSEQDAQPGGPFSWVHTKALYRLSPESTQVLRGLTHEMCLTDHRPRGLSSKVIRTQDPFKVEPGLVSVSTDEEQYTSPALLDPCDIEHHVPGVCEDVPLMPAPASAANGGPHVLTHTGQQAGAAAGANGTQAPAQTPVSVSSS